MLPLDPTGADMDINQLLAREQAAIMRFDAAGKSAVRAVQEAAASHYGALLSASAYPHRPYRRRGRP